MNRHGVEDKYTRAAATESLLDEDSPHISNEFALQQFAQQQQQQQQSPETTTAMSRERGMGDNAVSLRLFIIVQVAVVVTIALAMLGGFLHVKKENDSTRAFLLLTNQATLDSLRRLRESVDSHLRDLRMEQNNLATSSIRFEQRMTRVETSQRDTGERVSNNAEEIVSLKTGHEEGTIEANFTQIRDSIGSLETRLDSTANGTNRRLGEQKLKLESLLAQNDTNSLETKRRLQDLETAKTDLEEKVRALEDGDRQALVHAFHTMVGNDTDKVTEAVRNATFDSLSLSLDGLRQANAELNAALNDLKTSQGDELEDVAGSVTELRSDLDGAMSDLVSMNRTVDSLLASSPGSRCTEEPSPMSTSQIPRCSGTIRAQKTEMAFTSPGYPSNYPGNSNCLWKIVAPDNYKIEIRFTSFSMERHDSCTYDYVRIYEGDSVDTFSKRETFCGSSLPGSTTYSSTGNIMTAKFKSDGSEHFRGFRATVKAICTLT